MKALTLVLCAAATIALATTSRASAGAVTLTGAGATFPKPIYDKWSSNYAHANAEVRINYQGIGSGGGIKQITEKTVDFGASDMPMTEKQLEKAPGILHIPMVMGAVVPIYNLSGVNKTLVFSGPVLADIYAGKITKWNDPQLVKLNPDANLPAKNIGCVYRSDGSGTTFVFTDYLSKVSKDWEKGPGRSSTINWPVGRGAKGNDGVAQDVSHNDGSIGYVELIYAANNKIAYGDVVNAAGAAVHASEESVSAAAATLKDIPQDLRVSITNSTGQAAFPISSLTWILVYKDQSDPIKGKAVANFLWWCTHEGQAMAGSMHYAPLPREFVPLVEAKIKSITAGGQAAIGD